MRTLVSAAAAAIALAGISSASAETISQTIPFDWGFMNDDPITLSIQGFDNQDGTRQLTEIRFVWEGAYSIDYRLENTGPTAVTGEDYWLLLEHNALHIYGPDGGEPFYTPSALWLPLAQNLDGNGGIFENTHIEPYTNIVVSDPINYPTTFEIFDTPGQIDSVFGGFGFLQFFWLNEPVGWDPPSGPFGDPVYPTDDAIWFFYDNARHYGTLTVEYDYTTVPAPGALALLGVGGIGAMSRRRR